MTDDATPAQTLDCVGLYCPEPLFQTRESIDAIEIGLRQHGLLPILLDRLFVTPREAGEALQLCLLMAILQGDPAQEIDHGLRLGEAGGRRDDIEPRDLAGLVHGAQAPGHESALPVELVARADQLAPGLDERGVDRVELPARDLPPPRDDLHLGVQPLHLRARATGLLLQLDQGARRAMIAG